MHKVKPDYQQGSLVNLVASLTAAMGHRSEKYAPTPLLSSEQLQPYDNIILVLIDGLGSYNLANYGKDTVLAQNKVGDLTSVFPSTTSAAITTINTGVAPMQHAATGWFVYLRELATVAALLPFIPRAGGEPFSSRGANVNDIIDVSSIYPQLERPSYAVSPQFIVDSDYSVMMTQGAQRLGFNKLDEFYDKIAALAKEKVEKKFIYAYWSEYDGMCHTLGVANTKTIQHLHDIDHGFARLLKNLEGSNSIVVLTADHGLVDTAPDKVIHIEDYPDIHNCLRIPLCGEPRASYCYVKAGDKDRFVALCEEQLGEYCEVVASQQLVDEGYFGIGDMHEELLNRIGDFVLLMKDNYVIKDRLINEKPFTQTGVHGGVSAEEMTVPLIVAAR